MGWSAKEKGIGGGGRRRNLIMKYKSNQTYFDHSFANNKMIATKFCYSRSLKLTSIMSECMKRGIEWC